MSKKRSKKPPPEDKEDPEQQKLPSSPGEQKVQYSPALSVRKLGSGTFVPITDVIPARPITAIMSEDGPQPIGTLLTPDAAYGFSYGVEIALSNPARALDVYGDLTHVGSPGLEGAGDLFLKQLRGLLEVAAAVLKRIERDGDARDDRILAHTHIATIREWTVRASASRSGRPATVLEIPGMVVELASGLGKAGRCLRFSWEELCRRDDQNLARGEDESLAGEARRAVEDSLRAREKADLRARLAAEAKLSVEACACYARPGAAMHQLSGIPIMDPGALLDERMGRNDQWEHINEMFCRNWIQLWASTLHSVRHVIAADRVARLKLISPAAKLCRKLYEKLLVDGEAGIDVEVLVADLVQARVRLGPARFELAGFFLVLLKEIEGRTPQHAVLRAGGKRSRGPALKSPSPEVLQASYVRLTNMTPDSILNPPQVMELLGLDATDPKTFLNCEVFVQRSGRKLQAHQMPRKGQQRRRSTGGTFGPKEWWWTREEVLAAVRGHAKRLKISLSGPF